MPTGPERLAAPPETADDPSTTDPPISDIMTTHLVGITPDSPLSTALRLMASTGVRHLPVLEGQRCLGMVVETDLVRCLAQGPEPTRGSELLGIGPPLLVGEVVRRVEPVAAGARRSDAARRMRAEHADAVLVSDRGRLVGIVTATDLIRSLAGTAPTEHATPGEPS